MEFRRRTRLILGDLAARKIPWSGGYGVLAGWIVNQRPRFVDQSSDFAYEAMLKSSRGARISRKHCDGGGIAIGTDSPLTS
ncbi:hypothetical protein BUALT_Bualt11G0109000 [Buddleja alternifolia]|uniref:Uncharacterized protein n=1 Tax=Buddleja alternifolia TaxID=168488 RepID=A0AAV6WUY7_9LAMI|nr:hypothetical protein BUALT_Bualt11G0108900 [Buddleja alternifolia]KAG8374226.1 hypothetical protein BUALT_Bualt11G0109000 [Buddleja alternifolia]